MTTTLAAASASHIQLQAWWTMPTIPCGFDALVYCNYGDNGDLDFVNNTRRDFASELLTFTVPWPWMAGFSPSPKDWQCIGIEVIDFR